MFILDTEKESKLYQFIESQTDKITKDGNVAEGFDHIFETLDFFENEDFTFILDIMKTTQGYIKACPSINQEIRRIKSYYDLIFPLNTKRFDIYSFTQKDLLYFIHDFPFELTRITPPKLILCKESQTSYWSETAIDQYTDYSIQKVPQKLFGTNNIDEFRIYIVTYNRSKNENAYNTTIWFELDV